MSLNKIYNKDCLEGMKLMEDNSIDLIVTDPPYKTTSRGCAGNSGGMLQEDINKKGQVFNHNEIDAREYSQEFYRLLKDGSHCYIMTNHINLNHIMTEFSTHTICKECGEIEWNVISKKCKQCDSKDLIHHDRFHFIKSLVWDKGNKIMGQYYMSQFEYILFFRKGKGVKINNCGTSDILSIPNKKTKGEDGKNIHNTEKPVELMKILIENSSKENDVVLDPFMGVGSTALACIDTNRNYLGFELDEEYYNIAIDRIGENK